MNAAPKWQTLAWTTLRGLVALVFLAAGVLKWKDPQGFADSIATFRMLPAPLVAPLALGLPPLEILTGALLLLGWRARAISLAACLLSAIFTLALATALARGLPVDCGCFGGGGIPSPLKTVFSLGRDLLLLAASVALYGHAVNASADRNPGQAPPSARHSAFMPS